MILEIILPAYYSCLKLQYSHFKWVDSVATICGFCDDIAFFSLGYICDTNIWSHCLKTNDIICWLCFLKTNDTFGHYICYKSIILTVTYILFYLMKLVQSCHFYYEK